MSKNIESKKWEQFKIFFYILLVMAPFYVGIFLNLESSILVLIMVNSIIVLLALNLEKIKSIEIINKLKSELNQKNEDIGVNLEYFKKVMRIRTLEQYNDMFSLLLHHQVEEVEVKMIEKKSLFQRIFKTKRIKIKSDITHKYDSIGFEKPKNQSYIKF